MATTAPAVAIRPPVRATAQWQAIVVGAAVVAIGVDLPVYRSLTLGTMIGLALLPVWWSSLARYRWSRTLLVVGGLAVVNGLWLTEVSSNDHRTSSRLAFMVSAVLVNMLVATGVILWARTQLRTSTVAVLFGLGAVAVLPLNGVRLDAEAWRFEYSVPITVLALAVAWRLGRRWLEFVAALALAAGAAVAGGRSTFAMLLVAAVAVAWQATSGRTRAGARFRIIALSVTLLFALYQIGQGLILDGYLGESAQARTEAQIQSSGNVLLGARPEMGATIALIAHHPLGFGAGTLSSLADVRVAKTGMAALGYDPNNGYVSRYMFGSGYELHSVIGDAWAAFGLFGLVFTLLMLTLVTWSAVGLVARRAASALVVFLAVRLVWDVFFGPIYSSSTLMAVTAGLVLAAWAADDLDGAVRR